MWRGAGRLRVAGGEMRVRRRERAGAEKEELSPTSEELPRS